MTYSKYDEDCLDTECDCFTVCGTEEDDDPGYCPNCSGSGEGQIDGQKCSRCKGSGMDRRETE